MKSHPVRSLCKRDWQFTSKCHLTPTIRGVIAASIPPIHRQLSSGTNIAEWWFHQPFTTQGAHMLFDTYEKKGLLFNMNFKEAEGNFASYRGDLVLELGEVGDAHGHLKPPVFTIKNTIVLAESDKIKL
jgi:hypothetical protein